MWMIASRRNIDGEAKLLTPQTLGLNQAAYSVKEAMALLSLGRTSLYSLVRNGDLKATKFGKKTLFLSVDLAAFLSKLPSRENRG